MSVLDDEDDAGLITTGSIVTVSVTVKRRNLGVSSFQFKTVVVLQWYMHIEACCHPFSFVCGLKFFHEMESVRSGSLIIRELKHAQF